METIEFTPESLTLQRRAPPTYPSWNAVLALFAQAIRDYELYPLVMPEENFDLFPPSFFNYFS